MIKIVGMTLVLLSSSMLGYLYSLKFSKRINTLRLLISALNLLITEISYTRVPLSEAFVKVSKLADPKIKTLFLNTAHILENSLGYTASEAWYAALKGISELNLNNEDIEILKSFGDGLGNSDIYSQENNYKLTVELLKNQLKNAEKSGEKNEKMYKNLGILLGIAIIIIFV